MKKHVLILLALVPGMLIGCSVIGIKSETPVIGKWTAIHQSGAEIIFEFKPDMTMTCSVPEAPDYSFTANYTVDTSKNPTTVDLDNIKSVNIGGVCLAIVQLSGDNKMEFYGTFGESGQVSRPSEFSKYADLPNLYLEFNKVSE